MKLNTPVRHDLGANITLDVGDVFTLRTPTDTISFTAEDWNRIRDAIQRQRDWPLFASGNYAKAERLLQGAIIYNRVIGAGDQANDAWQAWLLANPDFATADVAHVRRLAYTVALFGAPADAA